MKEIVKNIIDKTIRYLFHIQNKLESEISNTNNYHTLSPTDEAENVDCYIQSLDWALKNKNRIKNIAISGAYGSGKSSVIRTFIKRNKNKDYRFLNISLATFKEQKEQPDVSKNGDNDILRLIELSVLQQLFYHEEDEKIPDSRFKRIKSHKSRFLFYYSFGFIVFLISLLFIIAPDFLSDFYLITIPPDFNLLAHYTATTIVLFGLLFIIFKSSRAIKNLTIKKLNISNAEIEIDSEISKSILNNHIDEILYFFEVTNYNVVIIEDLDRFAQTEVFTKLREINLLINNSKKVDNEVVFIYAIKDDMFLDKDRTKFFDFMIPIIPVINSSNSNEKLLDIIKKNDYKISTDLIDNISLFIDDMRLLYNIMNEYYIYSTNLDSKLDQDKLLSMIVYKNIYPNDFSLLVENNGDLFKTIYNKSTYIKNRIAAVDEQIEVVRKQIVEAEKIKISDLKELKLIYINKIIEQIITTQGQPFKQFWIKNQAYDINSLTDETLFSNLFSGTIEYIYGNYNSHRGSLSIPFKTIENMVNPDLNYKQRESIVLNKGRIENLKKQVSDLENTKTEIRKSKLSDLITESQITINQKSSKQSELINILLRNGYIDENYLDYVSIFYEGSLSKTDYQFLIKVKIQQPTEFDYKLNKIERLVEKINLFDFEKEYILNFDLLEFLQQKPNDNEKKKRLFKKLSDQSINSIRFIDRFIEITTDIDVFIQTLCEFWQKIWIFIENESLFDDEKKDNYLTLIIKYAKVEDIKVIFSSHQFVLNKRSDFLQIIDDENKLKKIIEKLDLKFEMIKSDSSASLIDFVYKGNYYELNMGVIEMLLRHYNKFDINNFSIANYYCIMSSSLDFMINYINENIGIYVNSIYLKIESNTEEPLEYYLKLLNNETLEKELKEKIISQVKTSIKHLETIHDRNLWDSLLKESKVNPSWENILLSFQHDEHILSEKLVAFMNTFTNAIHLSNVKMPKEGENVNFYKKLAGIIIAENKITDETYNLITKAIPWWYNNIEFDNIARNRAISLIKNDIVGPTIENYKALKEYHDGLNILLIEIHSDEFVEKVEELEIDGNDLELILKSSNFSDSEKNIFLDNCDEEIIKSNDTILRILSESIINNNSLSIKISTLKSILLCKMISEDSRISIFNRNLLIPEVSFIEQFLKSIGEEYEEIVRYNKKATLNDNSRNRQLLSNLVSINYISSVSIKDNGLMVNHKKNRNSK